MQNQESIYSWIPKTVKKPVKEKLFHSHHNPNIAPTGSTLCTHGTTRLPGAALGDELHQVTVPRHVRPPVPTHKEISVCGLKTNKNFITSNAVEVILSKPKSTPPQKDYLKKKDFGKKPTYLRKVQNEIAEETRIIEEMMAPEPTEEEILACNELDSLEREELLRQLKQKWDDLNHQYQRISHNTMIDTLFKQRRKEGLEKELAQVESDIQLLSEKRPIVIA